MVRLVECFQIEIVNKQKKKNAINLANNIFSL